MRHTTQHYNILYHMATHCNVIDSKSAKSLDSEGTKTLPLGTLAHHHQDIFNCRSFYLWLSTFARSPYLWLSTSFSPSLSSLHALSLARSLPRLLSLLLALSRVLSLIFLLALFRSLSDSRLLACSQSFSRSLFFRLSRARAIVFSRTCMRPFTCTFTRSLSVSISPSFSLSYTHQAQKGENL